MNEGLVYHEWFIISVMTGITVGICMAAAKSNVAPCELLGGNKYIEVLVVGDVVNSGVHKVISGTKIKEIVVKAEPLPDAKLKWLKMDGLAHQGQMIRIAKPLRKRDRMQKKCIYADKSVVKNNMI